MKRKFYYGFVCLLAFLCLAACRTTTNSQTAKTSSSTQKELTVEQLLKKVRKANKNNQMTSVALDMSVDIKSNSGSSHQDFSAQSRYNNGDLIGVNLKIEDENNGTVSYEEDIITQTDGNKFDYYQRTSEDNQWTSGKLDTVDLDPDYFSFLDIIYNMADDLTIEEEDDAYVLNLRSQNIDIISLFSDELNLTLTGVEQTEVDKDFEISFDKKTFYLTGFDLSLNYSGSKGKLVMDVDGSYSDWNKVSDSVFYAPTTDNI